MAEVARLQFSDTLSERALCQYCLSKVVGALSEESVLVVRQWTMSRVNYYSSTQVVGRYSFYLCGIFETIFVELSRGKLIP